MIARLLDEPPHVLATGGGAFMDEATRAAMKERAFTIWLKAPVELLLARVKKRETRPLLKDGDMRGTLERLLAVREPVYAKADMTLESADEPHGARWTGSSQALRERGIVRGRMSEIITVGLGERGYDIHVGHGLLAEAGALLKPLARGPVPVVTDAHVGEIHLADFLESCGKAGMDARPIVMPPGEESKSFAGLERIVAARCWNGDRPRRPDRGAGRRRDRRSHRLCRRRAQARRRLRANPHHACWRRWIPRWAARPRSTRAQGKNLIGLFHQPRIVIADTALLATLPRRELLAGYAEVVKYGALGDAEFFDWLEAERRQGAGGRQGRHGAHAVAHSCRMKADIVARDERETGERALLNLGHTFGHALEAATGFSDRLLHGEGVAIGMALAFRLSVQLGLCPGQDAERFVRHLQGRRPALGHCRHSRRPARRRRADRAHMAP